MRSRLFPTKWRSPSPTVGTRLFPHIRNVGDRGGWQPLRPEERIVQFGVGDDGYYRRIAKLIAKDREVLAHFLGIGAAATNLEFLRFLPDLRRVRVDAYELESLDGLRYLSDDVRELAIGWTARPLQLTPVHRFRALTTLSIERQHRGIEMISDFLSLEDLTLRSMTLPDLSVLLPLTKLRSLDIKLGGTSDLSFLPRIGRLTYLELWLIRGLENLDAIGDVVTLESLFLQALKHVTRLPSLRRLERLHIVHLETMPGLTDLGGVADAPALETVRLYDFGHASPDIVRPFIGHPTLREAAWDLGSLRKSFAAQDLLPLDPRLQDREGFVERNRELRSSSSVQPDRRTRS